MGKKLIMNPYDVTVMLALSITDSVVTSLSLYHGELTTGPVWMRRNTKTASKEMTPANSKYVANFKSVMRFLMNMGIIIIESKMM